MEQLTGTASPMGPSQHSSTSDEKVASDAREKTSLAYQDVRDTIETGDILLFKGEGMVSRAFRWGSSSNYSHAGMTAWWGNRLVVLQSAWRGVEALPVSKAVDIYNGAVEWWSVGLQERHLLDRNRLFQVAIDTLGAGYGFRSLFALVWRTIVNRIRRTPDPKSDPDSLFCSQYVSFCYRESGLDLRPDTADACTSPGDLATSGRLHLRGVLHTCP